MHSSLENIPEIDLTRRHKRDYESTTNRAYATLILPLTRSAMQMSHLDKNSVVEGVPCFPVLASQHSATVQTLALFDQANESSSISERQIPQNERRTQMKKNKITNDENNHEGRVPRLNLDHERT